MKPDEKPRLVMRKQPTQSRSIATVQAILEGAARILVEQGYAKANTNVIARRAGVSIGSLYEYFPGKEAIFAEIRRRQSQELYSALTTGVNDTDLSSSIKSLIETHLRYVRENLDLHLALTRDVPWSAIADIDAAHTVDYLERSQTFLKYRSLRPQGDPVFISEFLMRLVASTINDFAFSSPEHLDNVQLEESLVDIVGRYLIPDD